MKNNYSNLFYEFYISKNNFEFLSFLNALQLLFIIKEKTRFNFSIRNKFLIKGRFSTIYAYKIKTYIYISNIFK